MSAGSTAVALAGIGVSGFAVAVNVLMRRGDRSAEEKRRLTDRDRQVADRIRNERLTAYQTAIDRLRAVPREVSGSSYIEESGGLIDALGRVTLVGPEAVAKLAVLVVNELRVEVHSIMQYGPGDWRAFDEAAGVFIKACQVELGY